jgi:hypothetical protein
MARGETHRLVVMGAHALAAGLAVAAAAVLELPAWAAVVGVLLVCAHMLAALAVGGATSLALSAVPVLLGVALVLEGSVGDACDPCTGGWRGVPLGVAPVLTFVLLVDILAGPWWGIRRRRRRPLA